MRKPTVVTKKAWGIWHPDLGVTGWNVFGTRAMAESYCDTGSKVIRVTLTYTLPKGAK